MGPACHGGTSSPAIQRGILLDWPDPSVLVSASMQGRMRGARRSARGESSRKAAGREVEPFTLCGEMSHLTRATSEPCRRARGAAFARRARPFSAYELVSAREAGRAGGAGFSAADRAYLGRQHIPTKGPWGVDDVESEAYVSQFSADGSLLIAGFRGSRIRVYDAEKGWKIHKDISCRSVHWTVSDIALSPDQRFLAYASLTPIVHIVNVQNAGKESHANITEIHEGLDLTGGDEDEDFGIFSVKFSKDGKEVVVGNNEKSIYVYDLSANKVSARIRAHKENHFCDHLLSTVSLRLMSMLLPSLMKLETCCTLEVMIVSVSRPVSLVDWDYRWMPFPSEAHNLKHPGDQSVATYRGHSVLRTLIRCYFSPVHSTGQRYIYTGSSDKSVHIYDVVTGEAVKRLSWHGSIIRDCTWHPYYPTLVSSSWDGFVARWEASGDDDDHSVLVADEMRGSPYYRRYGDPLVM
ncbi:transducin family protein / WD-40 repeat family protein [Zea mays]|uniref:Transducin family protein / WD-40 repeat family protein n=1 Tax=Zea mays TaxID=4577 RepID=A0A1D6FUQ8_MAIZE|nr:transducin family protein / WD-40 repeat family protein [Zea mays]